MKNTPLNTSSDPGVEAKPSAYRTGVAARLAGLSVETLRVWERRYQLSNPARSERGQRLYSAEQVRRLTLLKQLVDQGHAIGMLAELTMAQLQTMSGASAAAVTSHIRVVVIGVSIARRLAAGGQDSQEFAVLGSCTHLEQAATLPMGSDVLIIEVSELDRDMFPAILQARQTTQARAVLVLYRFCASTAIRALREQGCLLARVPTQLAELGLLCRAAVSGQRLPPAPAAQTPAIQFDEDKLASVMAIRNRIACECPKHLAELLMMVGSFERYSAQCASRDQADAQLHQALEAAAGQARGILENAMAHLLQAEGLWPLPK